MLNAIKRYPHTKSEPSVTFICPQHPGVMKLSWATLAQCASEYSALRYKYVHVLKCGKKLSIKGPVHNNSESYKSHS